MSVAFCHLGNDTVMHSGLKGHQLVSVEVNLSKVDPIIASFVCLKPHG